MAETTTTRTSRVYFDESTKEVYQQLKGGTSTSPDEAPFETFKDIFMVAVCQGFQTGHRRTVQRTGGEIPLSVFTDDDMAILKAIAIAETDDVQILNQLGEILGIAEEYANAGIYEVKNRLLGEHGRPLWNLVNILTN